jgi:phosphatidylcholine synthase
MPHPNPLVLAVSLAYLVYYGGLSLYLTFWVPRRTKAV